MNKKVFCRNCTRWYKILDINQCNIPDGGLHLVEEDFTDRDIAYLLAKGDLNREQIDFIESKYGGERLVRSITNPKEYLAEPSRLNVYNDCFFYKEEKKTSFFEEIKLLLPHLFVAILFILIIVYVIVPIIK